MEHRHAMRAFLTMVSQKEKDELIAIVASTKGDIVEK